METKFFIKRKSQLTNIELLRYCLVVMSKFNKQDYKGIHYFLGLIIAVFLSILVSAEPSDFTSRYSMHLLGANIGEFSVRQTGKSGNVSVEAVTDVKVNLLISYREKYIQHTFYNQGVLQSSRVETYKNGS